MSEEMTMAELLAASEESIKEIKAGDLVEAEVVAVNDSEAVVSIKGNKNDVPIPKHELADPTPESARDIVKVGDVIEVMVVAKGGENGLTASLKKAASLAAWKDLDDVVEKGEPVDAEVKQVVKGGLVVTALGVRAFIPASQVELHFVKDLTNYVGQTIQALPIEVDSHKQRLVLSRRQLLEAERARKQKEVFENVHAGDTVKGIVKRTVDYGAFIDIGGVDGLCHISDLSWSRVRKPADVVSEGQEVDVLVKSIDPETKRISLSIKDTMRDPWLDKAESYEEGSTIIGKIIKLTDFGAFMEIEPGFDGLIPMGELAEKRINRADEAVSLNDEVRVKVLRIDMNKKRISLSITKAKKEEAAE